MIGPDSERRGANIEILAGVGPALYFFDLEVVRQMGWSCKWDLG